jgi:sarcosine oxidase subunit beta
MSQTADAIVIGAGVIGAAVAYELARAGRKVMSIDAKGAAGHGSTAGSCAIIRVHYSTLEGCAMAWEGYHDWADWRAYLGASPDETLAEFRQTGCLVMKTESNNFLTRHMEMSRALDCPFEQWDAATITDRLPMYRMDRFAPAKRMDEDGFGQPTGGALTGGVFWKTAGYVTDPALSAQNIAAAAQRHGAVIRFNSRVVEILQAGGRVSGVKLSDGAEIHAPVVVNVGGPSSARLNAMAGVLDDMTIQTRPLRQEVVHVPAPEGFDFENDGLVISDSDISCYCRPEHGNHILIGSEDPDCDTHQWVDDSDWSADFTDQWTTQALRFAQRMPSLGIPSRMRGVVELYDASTDWIPIYDRSALDGFYMACGSSGNQYKNAPVAGRLMAQLIEYCEAGGDHDGDPMPFRLNHIDREINAGFFSRKRKINQDSSFSVLG